MNDRPANPDRRLFLALDLPAAMRDRLYGEVQRLRLWLGKDGARKRWTRPEQWHITLRFLGNTPSACLPGLCVAAARTGRRQTPYRLSFGRPQVVSRGRGRRMIWLEPEEGNKETRLLAAGLGKALAAAGFGEAGRSFHPHLTLARISGLPDGADLAACAFSAAEAEPVDRFTLYQSTLTPRGAIHEALAVFPLGSQAP